jgi:hypothetical protein
VVWRDCFLCCFAYGNGCGTPLYSCIAARMCSGLCAGPCMHGVCAAFGCTARPPPALQQTQGWRQLPAAASVVVAAFCCACMHCLQACLRTGVALRAAGHLTELSSRLRSVSFGRLSV